MGGRGDHGRRLMGDLYSCRASFTSVAVTLSTCGTLARSSASRLPILPRRADLLRCCGTDEREGVATACHRGSRPGSLRKALITATCSSSAYATSATSTASLRESSALRCEGFVSRKYECVWRCLEARSRGPACRWPGALRIGCLRESATLVRVAHARRGSQKVSPSVSRRAR
jgi:hypothetical protein